MSENEHLDSRDQFRRFYTAHAQDVRNFLYYKCGDLQLAEDLMQEAFVRLWKKRTEIEVGKAKGYVFSVAKNLFLDHARHQQVKMKFQATPQRESTREDPQYEMEMEEFRERLETAIADLPEGQREVFLMSRIDKKSYKDIAELLEISVKAVEKRMSKALAALRKLHKRI